MKTLLQPRLLIPAAVIVLVLAAVGAYLFQPWKAFVDTAVAEERPEEVAEESVATEIFGLAHHGEGTVEILTTEDGERVLRIEDLDTVDGPDLFVWLSPQTADDPSRPNDYVDLGALKGNVGDQSYVIPDDVDLSDYQSVVIYCDRFSVAFAAAPLPA